LKRGLIEPNDREAHAVGFEREWHTIIFLMLAFSTVSGCVRDNLFVSSALPSVGYNRVSPSPGKYHLVAQEDSLQGIAAANGLDIHILAKVNNLKPPYDLIPGTKIFIPDRTGVKQSESQLKPTQQETQVRDSKGLLAWPVNGKVITDFGTSNGSHNSGINIQAKEGTPVKTAGPGKVGYIGSLPRYGNVILIEHPNRLVTVYAHLKDLKVKKGSQITDGQVIGTVGSSGRVDEPGLYFEVRSKSRPRNPLLFLERKPYPAS
jgi:murein DD-endopeptidase MepM/ murein hydrolase activator NlpD